MLTYLHLLQEKGDSDITKSLFEGLFLLLFGKLKMYSVIDAVAS